MTPKREKTVSMHIADGALSTQVMLAANLVAGGLTLGSLKKVEPDHIPRLGVLAAVFFLGSFLHVRIGPSSAHLLLNGLLGLVLGWAAMPALAVALFLQAILIGHGGLTALGANILGMGLPAWIVAAAFSRRCRTAGTPRAAMVWGAVGGGTAVMLTCLSYALLLNLSDPRAYALTVKALIVAHIPIVFAEAAVTGAAISFLRKVKPELL
ncbi:MAG: cobalt transporter CbiM [Lentisphaeria bacterium]|nr:cobalt transporter CbiM [Lentisphaeria bacterium]